MAHHHPRADEEAELQTLRCLCAEPRGAADDPSLWVGRAEQLADWVQRTTGLTMAGPSEPSVWGRVALALALEGLLACAAHNPTVPVPPLVCDWLREQFRSHLIDESSAPTWQTITGVLATLRL